MVDRTLPDSRDGESRTVATTARRDVHRVSPIQHPFWLIEVASPGAAKVVTSVDVDPPVEADAVRAAARALLERHAALRYVFRRRRGALWQFDIGVEDALAGLVVVTDVDRDAPIEAPSLKTGPLLGVYASADGCVRIATHHIVTDRWSLHVLRRDFLAGYDAARRGEAPNAEPAPPFGAFVDDLFAQRDAGAFDDVVGFWQRTLRGVRPMPSASGSAAVRKRDERRGRALELAAADADGIAAGARAARLTPYTYLLRTMARALHEVNGWEDVVLMAMAAGRTKRATWDTVGCFATVVPVRHAFGAAAETTPSAADQLAAGTLPFEWIVDALSPDERDALVSPDNQAFFARSDGVIGGTRRKALPKPRSAVVERPPTPTWGLELDVLVDLYAETLSSIEVTYWPSRLPDATIERVLVRMLELLREGAAGR